MEQSDWSEFTTMVHILFHITRSFCAIGNTKVITQSALQRFQEEMGKAMKDPYKVCNSLIARSVKQPFST